MFGLGLWLKIRLIAISMGFLKWNISKKTCYIVGNK